MRPTISLMVAAAALLASSGVHAGRAVVIDENTPMPRRRRTAAEEGVRNTAMVAARNRDAEIEAWNAAVDKRKAEKKKKWGR